jgi:hypothetical protein
VIITAYFDESGTHKGAPLSAIAGYVGDEQQWQEFNVRVRKLFADNDVRKFHLVDLWHSKGNFAGWIIDKKIQLTDELQHIANETLESGVTAFLSEENYQKHYCSLDWPRKARKDTKYCILFRACVGFTLDKVLHTERWAPIKELRVVLEARRKALQFCARPTWRRNWAPCATTLRQQGLPPDRIRRPDCWECAQGRDRREVYWRRQTSNQGRRLLPRQPVAGLHRA